ncbi:MAG: AI-2E family transporter, partial [Fervidobacterium sp.]
LFSQIQNINISNSLPDWAYNIIVQLGNNLSSMVMTLINQVITFVPSLVTMVMLLVATMIGLESIKSYIGKNLDLLFVEDPAYGREFATKLFSDVRRYVR